MRILGAATAQSKKVRAGLSDLGFKPEAVQASMANDPTGTILKVLDALNKLDREKRMVAATRIFGAEYGDDLAKLAVGANEYRRQLGLVNSEQAKGSVLREFNAQNQTTAAQWQTTKNIGKELSVAIGGALLPAINSLMSATAPMVAGFADMARQHPGLIRGIVGTAFALTGLRVATKGAQLAWVTLKTPVLAVMGRIAAFRAAGAVASLGELAPAATRVFSAVRMVGTAITAIGAIGAGPVAVVVGALVVGALVVRKYWEPIKAFFGGMFQGIGEAVAPALAGVVSALEPLRPIMAEIGVGIGKVVQWFRELLQPVNATSAQIAGATSAGRQFGAVIGSVISFQIRMLGGVIRVLATVATTFNAVGKAVASAWGTVWTNVRNAAGAAIDWIAGRLAPIVAAIAAVNGGIAAAANAVGLGSAVAPPPPAAQAPGRAAAARRPAAAASARTVGNTQRPRAAVGSASRAGVTRSPAQPAPTAAAPKAPPALQAKPASGRTVAAATPAKGGHTFNIYQQPGESPDALTQRVVAAMDARDRHRSRGRLEDEAA